MDGSLTITEALAEIKTLNKRIAKKRDFVGSHLARAEGNRDPLEKDGGSPEVVRRERQAIADLEQRVVDLRRAITQANLATELTVEGVTRSIYDWLTWRREVSGEHRNFLGRMQGTVHALRREAQQKGVKLVEGRGDNLSDVVINISETGLAEEIEKMETILGTLDGLLSHRNATVTVTV